MFLPTNLASCLVSYSRKSGGNHMHVLLIACLEKKFDRLRPAAEEELCACEFRNSLLLPGRVFPWDALSILHGSVPGFSMSITLPTH